MTHDNQQVPRTVCVCTKCWEGTQYDTIQEPIGNVPGKYQCKDCKAVITSREMLKITQIRGRFGNVEGEFRSNEHIDCPACEQRVQFETRDCREANMRCPKCGFEKDRLELGIYHFFDATVLPVG